MVSDLPYVIANHKANKTADELQAWLDKVMPVVDAFAGTVILCPSSPFLAEAANHAKIKRSKLKIGAQCVSKFPQGAYTGEFSASQLKDICDYCIVGHSERAKYFGETIEDVLSQIDLLIQNNVTPILCIRDENNLKSYVENQIFKNNQKSIIAVWEPPGAISGQGNYKPVTIDAIKEKTMVMQSTLGKNPILYGGSINPGNAKAIFEVSSVDGGLMGQASLDADEFLEILNKAA